MRYTGLLIGSILSAFIFARPAFAQDEYIPKQGDVRIGVSGLLDSGLGVSYFDIDGFKQTSIGFGLDYFLTESFTINLQLGWTEANAGEGKAKATSYGFGIGYYFVSPSTSNVLPFIRANYVGLDIEGFKPSGFTISGGAHIFVNPNASFDISLSYINLREGGSTVDGFGASIGLSLWFR